MKGCNRFNSDFGCFEVGITYEKDVKLICCNRGFHFCTKPSDCFKYYNFNSENKVAEVLDLVNIGKDCTGDWNTGNYNTGDWNETNFSSGCFNTEEQKMIMFDKPSNWTYRDWINSKARRLMNQIPKDVLKWICSQDMSDEEKAAHREYETTGGYLKIRDNTDCCIEWWKGLSKAEKNIIKQIPNFDADKFFEITGIKVGE